MGFYLYFHCTEFSKCQCTGSVLAQCLLEIRFRDFLEVLDTFYMSCLFLFLYAKADICNKQCYI